MPSWRTRIILLATMVVAAGILRKWAEPFREVQGNWGIDALLSQVSRQSGLGYQRLLGASPIGVLRERGVSEIDGLAGHAGGAGTRAGYVGDDGVRGRLAALKRRGFRIVAFATPPVSMEPRSGDQLPADLDGVYWQGRFLGKEFAELVDAWEMVGEGDLGYCTDLPDRVAAYQKAMYLGLKAGARDARGAPLSDGGYSLFRPDINNAQRSSNSFSAPIVTMGALGMPPGPWLERAAANGLLDYTDAYNFHFYGHAKDLTGVIAAHRAAIRQLLREPGTGNLKPEGWPDKSQVSGFRSPVSAATVLPLWITEAGLAAVSKDDFLNPQRRQLQADFTISTAKQALASEDVAMFMPFILVHDKDPYAMTLSPWRTFPAWDAYAKFTRENPWPKRPITREPRQLNPVVVQWLPDNATCVPKKTSGTYRFRDGQAIRGELRLYNFSERAVTGGLDPSVLRHATVRLGEGKEVRGKGDHESPGVNPPPLLLKIPAMGMISVPVEFLPAATGYFRETFSARFNEEGSQARASELAHGSRISFGLEAWAKIADFSEESVPLRPLPDGKIQFPQIEPYAKGEQVGVWTTINGLKGEPGAKSEAQSAKNPAPLALTASPLAVARFWIEKENADPLAPAMAVAAVDGLPAHGFIRLRLDKPMTKDRKVLVVLVDDRGQRYSIWENFGADYYGSRSDIWLNLEDFHADFWGPMSADYQFRPERIREVQLRFYLDTPDDKVGVTLSLLRAKR